MAAASPSGFRASRRLSVLGRPSRFFHPRAIRDREHEFPTIKKRPEARTPCWRKVSVRRGVTMTLARARKVVGFETLRVALRIRSTGCPANVEIRFKLGRTRPNVSDSWTWRSTDTYLSFVFISYHRGCKWRFNFTRRLFP